MFRTSAVYFFIRAINGILALTSIYVLTRLLSPEQYGIYALGVAGIGLGSSVLFQWIAVAVARFYSAYVAEPDVLLTEAYRLFTRIAAACTCLTIFFLILKPMPTATPVITLAIGIGTIAMGLHSLGLQIANARGTPISYGLLTASRGALALAFAILFSQAGWGGAGVLFGISLASVISVICFGIRRKTKSRFNSINLRRQIISYGLPLSLTYLANIILDVSDRFMIGWWIDAAAVAGYAAPYDLAQQTVGTALNVLFLSSYPRITRAWESGGMRAANKEIYTLSRTMQFAIPLTVGVFVGFSLDISNIFFGEAIRAEAARVMPWVALAIAVGCFKTYYLDLAFQLVKTTHVQLQITAAMALLNVVLNLFLIPLHGLVGAAMATTIAYFFGALLSWWRGRKLGFNLLTGTDLTKTIVVLFIFIFAANLSFDAVSEGYIKVLIRLVITLTFFSVAALAINLAGIRNSLFKKL